MFYASVHDMNDYFYRIIYVKIPNIYSLYHIVLFSSFAFKIDKYDVLDIEEKITVCNTRSCVQSCKL
jgi:hypothetical protein